MAGEAMATEEGGHLLLKLNLSLIKFTVDRDPRGKDAKSNHT